jgi:HEAT repeat protein
MTKRGIIIAGIVGAAAVAAAVASSSGSAVAKPLVRSAGFVPGMVGADTTMGGPILEIGTEHLYEVSFVQSVRTETATSSDISVTLDGAWAVAYAGSDDRGLVFRAELRDGKPTVRRGAVDASAAFSDTLRRAYYFTTTSEGRLVDLHFDAAIDDVSRATLTTLASTFQVSSRSRAASWEAVESDSLGDYRARYVRGPSLHRERVAYDRVSGGNTMIAASIVKTGTDIALRGDGWPERVEGNEVTRIGTNEISVIVDAKFKIHHRAVAHGVKPGWHDGLTAVAVDATTSRVSQDQADRELVAGASLSDLLAELARLGDDDHARGYQFLRIAALFRLDPDAARAGARLVLDGKAQDAEGVLLGALGDAGTPDAQRALHDVMAAPLADDTRTRAAIALGLTEAPTQDTLTALEKAAKTSDGDLASSATLAQGNAALRMRDESPGASAHQVDALLARLELATTDEERALVIRALGNTADERIVPALDRALASSSVMLRIAATEALRLLPGSAVDVRLLARLGDGDSLVRAAAVFATGERDLRAFTAVFDRLLRSDPTLEVRRAIIGLAGARIDELPALRALIDYAAAHDQDADLRAMAKEYAAQQSS